ncbi:MAG TPA: TetR/AcrR family transcriptional regulator, partial [Variovorax sp.]|nr:TetR/AcrR family transcriptional regulator [Variovorax sp.]
DGYSGARVDVIAERTRTTKRMIYYYFGSKEGLFIAVIEGIYRRMDEAEAAIDLDETRPVEALTAIIRFVLGYYRRNPEFVTLLNTENLHKGKHIAKSLRAREYSSHAIEILQRVVESGVKQGLFRPNVAARDLYLLIAATGYFYTSNRYTLSAFMGEQLESPEAVAHWEQFVIETVLRTVDASTSSEEEENATHEEDKSWQKQQPAASRAR